MTPAEGIEYLEKVRETNPDMPVFILLGKDLFSPATIMAWSAQCSSVDPKLELTRAKGERGREQAADFRRYQREHGAKLPD